MTHPFHPHPARSVSLCYTSARAVKHQTLIHNLCVGRDAESIKRAFDLSQPSSSCKCHIFHLSFSTFFWALQDKPVSVTSENNSVINPGNCQTSSSVMSNSYRRWSQNSNSLYRLEVKLSMRQTTCWAVYSGIFPALNSLSQHRGQPPMSLCKSSLRVLEHRSPCFCLPQSRHGRSSTRQPKHNMSDQQKVNSSSSSCR